MQIEAEIFKKASVFLYLNKLNHFGCKCLILSFLLSKNKLFGIFFIAPLELFLRF